MIKKHFLNRKGFTLVELIVVIAILVILAAILVPTMMGVVGDANEKTKVAQEASIKSAMRYFILQSSTSSDLTVAVDESGKLLGNDNNDKTVDKSDIVKYFDGDLKESDFEIILTVTGGEITGITSVTYKVGGFASA